jgi:hypothetical protein
MANISPGPPRRLPGLNKRVSLRMCVALGVAVFIAVGAIYYIFSLS